MTSLSHEDALRLNVLLTQQLQAIRIDETRMVVHALTAQGEVGVPLSPNRRADQYLRSVRELLSGHLMDSPGGYPVFLKRWTRMGQARDENLEQMLLLGEQEAVVAVVCAKGLTDELARRAWWAMPTAENARRMLERDAVVRGSMGKVLSDYLYEHLPFEEDPLTIARTVRLMLRAGLLDAGQLAALWARGSARHAYRVGFLAADPDRLPDPRPARSDLQAREPLLAALAADGNRFARQLLRVLRSPGQTFLGAVADALQRVENQDTLNAVVDVVAGYFAAVGPWGDPQAPIEQVVEEATVASAAHLDLPDARAEELRRFRSTAPELESELRAMLVLARLGYGVLRPILSRTTAVGTLMRRKLEPVVEPLSEQLAVLLGGERAPAVTPRRVRRRGAGGHGESRP